MISPAFHQHELWNKQEWWILHSLWVVENHLLPDNSMETEIYPRLLFNKTRNTNSLLVCSTFLETLLKVWKLDTAVESPCEFSQLFSWETFTEHFIFMKEKEHATVCTEHFLVIGSRQLTYWLKSFPFFSNRERSSLNKYLSFW